MQKFCEVRIQKPWLMTMNKNLVIYVDELRRLIEDSHAFCASFQDTHAMQSTKADDTESQMQVDDEFSSFQEVTEEMIRAKEEEKAEADRIRR